MPSDATRDALIDAAKRVMQRAGAGHLTLDAVAREAGVSKGGLLYHFPSKQALLRGMVECGIGQQERVLTDEIGPLEGKGAFARAFLRHACLAPADRCAPPPETVWSMMGAAANDPMLLQPAREMHARWKARLEEDVADPDMAALIRLVGHGLWSMELFGFEVPDEAQRDRIVTLLERLAGLEEMRKR